MEIIDDKVLLIRTKYPERITQTIKKSKVVKQGEVSEVAVHWDLDTAQTLRKLKLRNVPSTIVRDYVWPGAYPPMQHQKETASFFTLHKRAFCFNEQGTGKTAASIWAADYLMTIGVVRRVLIVCPLSIMQASWQSDLFKCAVHRSVGIAHGDRNKRKEIIKSNAEFVVINYDGVEVVVDDIKANGKFDLVIIDEANAYKNVTTKRWKAMAKIIGPDVWLWMMTGTPAAQSPTDAFGLAKMCVPDNAPKFFGGFRDMVMQNITRFKWIPKPNAQKVVFDTLQPAIRYTKEECIDLPEITHTSRIAPLTAQQEKYYRILKKEMLLVAAGEEVSSVNAATNLSKLLQISGGAVYTDSGSVIEFDVSNRLSVILEVIEEASHKVLVFVPFTHTINLLKDYLTKNGVTSEIVNGDVTVNKRTDIFKRFQEQENPRVLIIQPQAASHGVTLTAANVVIWYAPVTSIETYLQANARIHRQGQKNPMTVVHISGSPVENRLYAMLQNKLDIHTKLVDLYQNEINT
jgi:SNF2 family DNA or RNA helicase